MLLKLKFLLWDEQLSSDRYGFALNDSMSMALTVQVHQTPGSGCAALAPNHASVMKWNLSGRSSSSKSATTPKQMDWRKGEETIKKSSDNKSGLFSW